MVWPLQESQARLRDGRQVPRRHRQSRRRQLRRRDEQAFLRADGRPRLPHPQDRPTRQEAWQADSRGLPGRALGEGHRRRRQGEGAQLGQEGERQEPGRVAEGEQGQRKGHSVQR